MKIIIDENLSPALARALNALFDGEHQVVHIRDRFGPSVKDVDWIGSLSAEGRWIIISGDTNIARKKAEQAAFRNSRLIGFFLAHALTRRRSRNRCSACSRFGKTSKPSLSESRVERCTNCP